jgi:hypothetical protein
MPSFKTVAIAVGASLVFFLGFMWWRGRMSEPPEQYGQVSQAAPRPRLRTVESALPRRDGDGPNVQFIAPKLTAKRADGADEVSAPAVPAAPVLPVLVHFYHRMRDPDQQIEGSIENQSDDDLLVTLNVMSAARRTVSRSMLDVPSQSRVVFGRDDGLNLGAGDQITLQVPTYGDLVQEIPQVR